MSAAAEFSSFAEAVADRYRVVGELGRGGMATVLRAEDLRHAREVAIKVLHDDLSLSVSSERFMREIRLSATLQHPLIVPLFESGDAAGRLYYVMPLVRGESLRDRLRRERQLPVPSALALLRDVADALAFAHARGVVHRDVKPENILLADGHALVADFGIARAVHAGGDEHLTSSGLAIGTPAYMSPEQATADHAIVDERTDVYALGCVAYEMLVGEPPFTGASVQAIIARQLAEAPRSMRVVRPGIGEALEAVVLRALEKSPADRHATVAEFATALEAAVQPGAIPSRITAAGRSPRRESRVRWLGLGVGLAVLAAAGWALARRGASPSLDPNLIAIAPFDAGSAATSAVREGLLPELARNLDGAGPLRTVAPSEAIAGWPGHADAATVTALARRTGAAVGVGGAVLPLGRDSVRLNATLYDIVRGAPIGDVQVVGAAARVGDLADSLALALLHALGQTRPIGAVRFASARAASLAALKAFLRGEQFFRASAWDSAAAWYGRALESDSLFALGHHRLFLARFLRGGIDDSLLWPVALRAGALNHGLAPRESLLVATDSIIAATVGARYDPGGANLARLVERTAAYVQRFPEDPLAWYHRGMGLYRSNAMVPDHDRVIFAALTRAVELDSAFAPAYVEGLPLAYAMEGDAAGRRWLAAYLAVGPTGNSADGLRLLARLMDAEPGDTAMRRLVATAPTSSLVGALWTATEANDPGEAEIAILAELRERPDLDRASVSRKLMDAMYISALVRRGHLRAASEAPVGPAPAMHHIATSIVLLTGPAGAEPPDVAAAVDGPLVPWRWPGPEAYTTWLRLRGDSVRLARLASRADALAKGAEGNRAYGRFLSAVARAQLLLLHADSSAALAAFDALPPWACGECQALRLTHARLRLRAGRSAEALPLVAPEVTAIYPGAIKVLVAQARAEAALAAGDREQARAAWQFVAAAWRHADPPIKRLADAAAAEAARLATR